MKRLWKQLYDAGRLAPPQTYFCESKPSVEVYELETDLDEIQNQTDSPEHRAMP